MENKCYNSRIFSFFFKNSASIYISEVHTATIQKKIFSKSPLSIPLRHWHKWCNLPWTSLKCKVNEDSAENRRNVTYFQAKVLTQQSEEKALWCLSLLINFFCLKKRKRQDYLNQKKFYIYIHAYQSLNTIIITELQWGH